MVKEMNTGFVEFRLLAPERRRIDGVTRVKIAEESRVADLGCPVTSSAFERAHDVT